MASLIPHVAVAFSPLGAAYLGVPFIPNVLWARLRSREADSATPNENQLLLTLERVGQVATTIAVLFTPASDSPGTARLACLVASLLATFLYELSWLRYFRTDRSVASFYRSLGPVPLPLALLPVLSILLLALYEVHVVLRGAVVVLGVGHVGIHRQRARRLH
ncbi:MAG TPA: hypothetical protein VEK07_18080 [Polyangiaceae bacterium]|nr:hypothetical protein [Polyangiaceae bacterium]